MSAMTMQQQRDELHRGVMDVFEAMGFPIPAVNKGWTLADLQRHVEDELPPEIEEPVMALAITAAAVHAHRIAEADLN